MARSADEELRAHDALAQRLARPRHLGAILGGIVAAPAAVVGAFIAAIFTMGDPVGNETPAEWDQFLAQKQIASWCAIGLLVLAVLSILWTALWAARAARYRFQSPPTWPQAPPGWSPPPGWMPPPTWPDPPEGWRFWRLGR